MPKKTLAALKAQTFTASGRAARIARSLAAVRAEQPTLLDAAAWRRVVDLDLEPGGTPPGIPLPPAGQVQEPLPPPRKKIFM